MSWRYIIRTLYLWAATQSLDPDYAEEALWTDKSVEALTKVVIMKHDIIKAEAFALRKAVQELLKLTMFAGRSDAHIAHVMAVDETSLEHERKGRNHDHVACIRSCSLLGQSRINPVNSSKS